MQHRICLPSQVRVLQTESSKASLWFWNLISFSGHSSLKILLGKCEDMLYTNGTTTKVSLDDDGCLSGSISVDSVVGLIID
jgi:hypothetical protein